MATFADGKNASIRVAPITILEIRANSKTPYNNPYEYKKDAFKLLKAAERLSGSEQECLTEKIYGAIRGRNVSNPRQFMDELIEIVGNGASVHLKTEAVEFFSKMLNYGVTYDEGTRFSNKLAELAKKGAGPLSECAQIMLETLSEEMKDSSALHAKRPQAKEPLAEGARV